MFLPTYFTHSQPYGRTCGRQQRVLILFFKIAFVLQFLFYFLSPRAGCLTIWKLNDKETHFNGTKRVPQQSELRSNDSSIKTWHKFNAIPSWAMYGRREKSRKLKLLYRRLVFMRLQRFVTSFSFKWFRMLLGLRLRNPCKAIWIRGGRRDGGG